MKNKKIAAGIQAHSLERQLTGSKPKTPDLVSTERVEIHKDSVFRHEEKKEKKSRKRNSVDESYLNEYNKREEGEKSVNLNKEG